MDVSTHPTARLVVLRSRVPCGLRHALRPLQCPDLTRHTPHLTPPELVGPAELQLLALDHIPPRRTVPVIERTRRSFLERTFDELRRTLGRNVIHTPHERRDNGKKGNFLSYFW
ncbi:hypothetical protein CgunFtcFv8_011025 [Champsocephalus gunnari]|uniref:Uncharacterized protein n=1 Tax=Champsocephalus gunnari TaxID=52237 RepID=A0AAN8HV45_CHAGU|nr:hypothetical protein CgunFtcFv8_011025 [Champsocephalus gunnari]